MHDRRQTILAHDILLLDAPDLLCRDQEQVCAVFDRNNHDSYIGALQLAGSMDGKLRNGSKQAVCFKAIASVPSFELWLLADPRCDTGLYAIFLTPTYRMPKWQTNTAWLVVGVTVGRGNKLHIPHSSLAEQLIGLLRRCRNTPELPTASVDMEGKSF